MEVKPDLCRGFHWVTSLSLQNLRSHMSSILFGDTMVPITE